jgi:hypothetical protein
LKIEKIIFIKINLKTNLFLLGGVALVSTGLYFYWTYEMNQKVPAPLLSGVGTELKTADSNQRPEIKEPVQSEKKK